jgi:hypothetical protein
MKMLLNVFQQFGEVNLCDSRVCFDDNAIGSTRVIVASLYSFPLTVLKSSAKAPDMEHRVKNVKTFMLISYLSGRSRFLF